MSSTITAVDPNVVGHNVQEICNQLGAVSAAAIVDIEALQAGGLVADLATTAPPADGTAAVGNGTKAARNNHVHPPYWPGFPYAGDAAASTTVAEMVIGTFNGTGKITALDLTPTGAISASDTVYATITIKVRDGAGGAAATVATMVTNVAGGSWTAFVKKTMGAITNGTVAAGAVLTMTIAKNTTGTQLPSFVIQPTFG